MKVVYTICFSGLLSMLVAFDAAAASDCPLLTDGVIIEAESDGALTIGQITIRTADLFDLGNSKQNGFIHSAANSLHLVTRNSTVFDTLPFRTGDNYSVEILAEGERILRSKRYLRDASVTAHRRCGDRIDIEVRTIDNWTLTPSVSFGSAGGENRYSVEIQDLNVLGLGKELKLRSSRAGDTKKTTFLYGDENIFGGRHQLRLELGDSDDGEVYAFQAGLPFYATPAQLSWWLSLNRSNLSFTNRAGSPTNTPVTTESVDFRLAKKVAGSTIPLARSGAGLHFSSQVTEAPVDSVDQNQTFDFEEFYPFITAQWSRSNWITKQNYQSIRNNEDIDLGLSIDVEAGLILEGFGNDSDAVRIDIDVSRGWYSGDSALHKFSFQQTQYIDNSDESKYSLAARYHYFRWLNRNDQLDLRLTAETHRGFSALYDFSIGGAEGLKAYPNEFQRGEQRVVGAAEYRHVANFSPFSLVHTGFAAFIEAGRAWSGEDESDYVANVGIGLLLAPTRSSRAAINRFDISVPLVDGKGVGNYQIFIGSHLNY